MEFSSSFGEISEAFEIKGESGREFSQDALDKFDNLFEGDGVDIGEENNERKSESTSDSVNVKFDKMFAGDGKENMGSNETSENTQHSDKDVSSSTDGENAEVKENKELTEEEKLEKIQDFLDGKIEFDEVKEIFAEYYANAVNSNKPWSWGENIPGGDELTGSQRKAIFEYAREKGMVPYVPIREENGKKYADFSAFKVFECILDKEYWDKRDPEQFAKCNEMLKKAIEENPELAKQFTEEQLEQINRGETPSGYTWHHSEKDGTMQLVPYGVHNSTYHHGGRSEGNWADSPR